MCGRYQAATSPSEIAKAFRVRLKVPNFAPNWNAAPTQTLPVVRFNPGTRERQLDLLRWGLVPLWAPDLSFGAKCINARSETLATTRSYAEPFAQRRCLVPAEGFYEWQRRGAGKQAYSIGLKDRSLFAFAGLWDRWKDPASGEWIRSFSIVTGPANDVLRPIHDRMPAIVSADDHAAWLGEEAAPPARLQAMLKPFPSELIEAWPVSAAVGSVRNNGPELRERIVGTA